MRLQMNPSKLTGKQLDKLRRIVHCPLFSVQKLKINVEDSSARKDKSVFVFKQFQVNYLPLCNHNMHAWMIEAIK